MIEVDKLGDIKPVAKEDFVVHKPNLWCKAYFDNLCKSDICDNNMCETFNAFIIKARYKNIATLLLDIRRFVMKRTIDRRKFVNRFK